MGVGAGVGSNEGGMERNVILFSWLGRLGISLILVGERCVVQNVFISHNGCLISKYVSPRTITLAFA